MAWLDGIIAKIKAVEDSDGGVRRTKAGKFEKVDVKEVVKKDIVLKYDRESGYAGTAVNGETVGEFSTFDRILIVKPNGVWSVGGIPEKAFVGQGAWLGLADKEALKNTVFTIVYKETKTCYPYIKRCVIEGWIINKEYSLVPDSAEVLLVAASVAAHEKLNFTLHYKPKPRLKVAKETFKAENYSVRGLKAGGIRLATREVVKLETR